MAGPLDFTGQNIEDSYQRVLQTDGLIITDGTGSFVNLQFTGSFSGSLEGTATTASYVQQAESASYVTINQGDGITVSGMTISANLRSVNGNLPDGSGNVSVSLAAVLTGTSASLASYATGGLAEGTVWIVSGDAAPEKNGTSYVYDSGSVGVWYQIAPLDQTAADARYARINTTTVQNLTSSFATTASYAANGGVTRILAGSGISLSPTNGLGAVTITSTGGGGGGTFPFSGSAVITGSLVVSSSTPTINGLTISPIKNTTTNISIGLGALLTVSSGVRNIGIGSGSLQGGNQSDNVAIGISAMANSGNTGYNGVAIGSYALQNGTGASNTVVGYSAMRYATSWASCLAVGFEAGLYLTGSNNTLLGVGAGRTFVGDRSVLIGGAAGERGAGSSTGNRGNVAIGALALAGDNVLPPRSITGQYNFAMGYRAMGQGHNGAGNTAIGTEALLELATGSYNVALGYRASQALVNGTSNFYMGYDAGTTNRYGNGTIAIGNSAARALFYDPAFLGVNTRTIAIGASALRASSTLNVSVDNIAIGESSMTLHVSGSGNISIGVESLNAHTSGSGNVAIGHQAMKNSPVSSIIENNVAIGLTAGQYLSGSNNTILGANGTNNPSGASIKILTNVVAVGANAGRSIATLSRGSVVIGPGAGPSSNTVITDRLFIASGSGNPLIGGDFANKTVTISGSIYISGSIIPNADATLTSSFELGSPTAAWNRIWVRSSSIHFVDDLGNELAKISANPAGAIEMPNIYTSGTFTAQTFVTQSTTTIIEIYHATGSNIFGSSSLDTHQFTGSVYISGGLEQVAGTSALRNVSISNELSTAGDVYLTNLQDSNQSYLVSINPGTGQLYYTASSAFTPINPDLSNYALLNGGNTFAGGQLVYDESSVVSIQSNQTTRQLYDNSGLASVDWGTRRLIDDAGFEAFDFQARQLFDQTQVPVLELVDSNAVFPQGVRLTGVAIDDTNIASSVVILDPATGQLYTTSSTAFVTNIGDVTTYLGPLNDFSASVLAFTSSIQTQVNNLTSATSSYVLNSATSSMSVLSSSYALTASYALNVPTVDTSALVGTASFNSFTSSIQSQVDNLTSATSSYVLNSATGSMLAPYVLSSATASMLSPYVLTSSTSSMSVLSSSYSLTSSYTSATLQTITDNDTTSSHDISVNSIGVYDGANSGYTKIEGTDGGVVISTATAQPLLTIQQDNITLYDASGNYASLQNALLTGNRSYNLPDQSGTIALVSGSIYGTASWAINAQTASNVTQLNQDVTIVGNLNVIGTASYNYITASQLDVGTNFISVNIGEPAERFGGLKVYDSGSLSHQATASLAWDSLNNHWIYQNASGSMYSGGMLLSGPRNTGSLGDEPSLTKWFIPRSDGGDHLDNSRIYSSASIHIATGSFTATSFTGSIRGHVTTSSIDTTQYVLKNSSGVNAINWETGTIGHPDTRSIDWINRYLIDGSDIAVVDWFSKQLYDVWGSIALDWSVDRAFNASYKYHQQITDLDRQEELSAAPLQYSGHNIAGGGPITTGQLCYLETDGKWYDVDQTTDTSTKMLGIAVAGKEVVLEGDVVLDNIQGANYGLPVYIREGTSAGDLSTTIPTSGYVRVIGHCYYDNAGTPGQWILKLRPSNDWYRI